MNVDPERFAAGQVGPYRLGKTIRITAFGEVILGLPSDLENLVEIELFDSLKDTPLVAPESPFMQDLAAVATIEHRHVRRLLGSGFADGVPYVVRPYRLGRTLAQFGDRIVREKNMLDPSTAAGILFAVVDACDFLAEQGEAAGVCSMGGFDARDVFLSFDGSIHLVGLGLKRARLLADESPIQADLKSCFALARYLDELSKGQLTSCVAAARSTAELKKALGKRFGEACANRHRLVGMNLRETFADAVVEERAFFQLPTLH